MLQTNAPFMKTGLAENGRILAKWLEKTGKYDLFYYCSQVGQHHPYLNHMPYASAGAIPSNPAEVAFLKQKGFVHYRDACYGGYGLHKLIEKEKPTIWWGSDDIWGFQPHIYNADWFKKINTVIHATIDSVPVSKMGYEQAKATKLFSWAKFAQKEMAARGVSIGQIYGAVDINKFKPISKKQKSELRKKNGISDNTFIFIYLGRNQLRKEFGNIIEAFSIFKKKHPKADAKLFFHTAFNEKEAEMGWNIPMLSEYYGLKKSDVLTTMFCRQCKEWEVRPYTGENTDCPFCGVGQSQVTCSIEHGVDDDEMHLLYGIADASISAFTSGGLEYHNVNSLLCGLPLASTNYSCGEDFCEQSFVYPISWHSRHENNTNYKKATNDVDSIAAYMEKTYFADKIELEKIGEAGRDWASKTFSIETIGPQWEKVFDEMKYPDYSTINFSEPKKNDKFPMPVDIESNVEWLKALYRGVFDMVVQDDDKGLNDWLNGMKHGQTREQIHREFLKIAAKENIEKSTLKIEDVFKNDDKKKILVVMKESGGDLFVTTALLENLKKLYPDANLYFACDPKFAAVLDGNPNIDKIVPFFPVMEEELAMMKFVDYYYYPALPTQKMLKYLTQKEIGVEL